MTSALSIEARFSPGSVVRLASGGPDMTVCSCSPVAFATGVWVVCQWFNALNILQQEMFHEDMLTSALT
nr:MULTISPECIES: YodC family protein [unclassified Caballeronia]